MHGDLLATFWRPFGDLLATFWPPTDARLFVAKVFELHCVALPQASSPLLESFRPQARTGVLPLYTIPSHIRVFSTHVSYPLYPLLTLHCTIVLVDLAP
jgi:hypothetical protein